MDERKAPHPTTGALELAYRAARAQWAHAPERLPELFSRPADEEVAALDASAVAATVERALYRWTGLPRWTTAFATAGGARLALLAAIDEFHHRYGTGRRVVLVPASRAPELARPIALARYRCVAVAESAPGVLRESALAKALDAYGRDIAAVWQVELGDPRSLERRQAEWQPLLDVGVKFVAEGTTWAWTFGRVPLTTLGIDGAIVPFPLGSLAFGARGVALGATDGLAAWWPVPPNPEALTDRLRSPRFLRDALSALDAFSPVPDPLPAHAPGAPKTKRRTASGKTVDEPAPLPEDTDRIRS